MSTPASSSFFIFFASPFFAARCNSVLDPKSLKNMDPVRGTFLVLSYCVDAELDITVSVSLSPSSRLGPLWPERKLKPATLVEV
ncbi:hypothetical protein DL95DRAFT_395979 [Leptodontidium sp. 2 PMI_412]|nr:hypothetical protein DL95DRAFT_395979 [Leptodontidium sp. 2 PMI_412]